MKTIPLTQGYVALVDDDHFGTLSARKWFAARDARGLVYARTKIDGRAVGMHRVIMNAPKGILVDHKNRNTLDNRRCNLRLATSQQNNANKSFQSRKFSYRGVLQTRSQKSYGAQIRVNRKLIYLGSYPTIEEAARAYDAAATRYFGEFASLNFPGDSRRGMARRRPDGDTTRAAQKD
ncbi:AP2 domain-containing protein [Chelativorans sp. Marseille-P2723]|uniref:AP2 domain-containing protein n=1 Tax=Chelativorans sp. Marseille-P2723 TaxID=2709133 RepID=UPI00156D8677|nr:AP2 domain-containing protein [Chelativorans sp. Marseille-P2723]